MTDPVTYKDYIKAEITKATDKGHEVEHVSTTGVVGLFVCIKCKRHAESWDTPPQFVFTGPMVQVGNCTKTLP